jgi:hypothetical protein
LLRRTPLDHAPLGALNQALQTIKSHDDDLRK